MEKKRKKKVKWQEEKRTEKGKNPKKERNYVSKYVGVSWCEKISSKSDVCK